MTNNKRQILTKRICCVVYSPVKLRTNEAENSRIASPNPKFTVLKKKRIRKAFDFTTRATIIL